MHEAHWIACMKPTGPHASNPLDHMHQTHWITCIKPTGPHASSPLDRTHQAHWTTRIKPTGPHAPSPLDHTHQAHWVTRFTLPRVLFLYGPFFINVTYCTSLSCVLHIPVYALAVITFLFADENNQSITDFTKIKLLTLQPLKRTREFL
jgi:hypothetical protein